VAAAHLGSTAWVGLERDGELVATARAVADGGKLAYVMDVAVRDDLHGEGLGRRLIGLLESHPAVRGCAWIGLHTRGAQGFYRRLGYADFTPPPDRVELRRYRTLAGPGTLG
ncbi:MAG: GNAT family N-acetyltransferase, partial [Myxococcales bacterium]|nr:GNAT family N-acetyltransferase [Myxococcales bacterium]